jgi:hypothetical protein
MKLVRAVASALSILALAGMLVALAVTPAAAKPRPEFKPKTGTYIGTMTSSVGTGEIGGQVGKEGKEYIILALLSTTETCADGTRFPGGVSIPAPLQGKSFSATETGTDSYTGGTATFKVSGHFSSEREFSGTAGKTSTEGSRLPGTGTCSTGPIKFTLKFRSSKPMVQ